MTTRLHAKIGTFRQLEILLTVYELGGINKASEALHLTQPTVSMQLKKLSDAINAPLYDQVGKKLVFTEAGKIVAKAAKDMMNRMNDLDMELSEIQGLKSGRLSLAVVTTSKYFIPHLLGPFCKRYPDIEVTFNVGNRQQIINRLQQGEDDFYVFSNLPQHFDIETIDFLDNPLVAIAPPNHPLAKKKNIPIQEIQNQPFLAREPGSGTRFAIENYLKQWDIKLNTKMIIESNEAIKHSVMSDLGISILSEYTFAFGEKSGFVKLDFKQLPIPSKWYLARTKAKSLSPIAKTFLHYVETEGKKLLFDEMAAAR